MHAHGGRCYNGRSHICAHVASMLMVGTLMMGALTLVRTWRVLSRQALSWVHTLRWFCTFVSVVWLEITLVGPVMMGAITHDVVFVSVVWLEITLVSPVMMGAITLAHTWRVFS